MGSFLSAQTLDKIMTAHHMHRYDTKTELVYNYSSNYIPMKGTLCDRIIVNVRIAWNIYALMDIF